MNTNSLRFVSAIAVVAMASTAPAGASVPAGRYTYPAAGTVYDTKTKLTWQRAPAAAGYNLVNAGTYCAGLGTTLGSAGWRLPTIKELQTIVDDSRVGPSIDPTAFPGTPASNFWSSTNALSSVGWCVAFSSGVTTSIGATSLQNVRCVR